ncbi:MAG: AAA family ATPase [Acidimicrobiales bacterium]|nr:AAA family ATPase [Acidimicrobiales bacterium]MYH73599.1 AAA family ATPase [Acidimicrobiales bacterium]MYK72381.1 AAA family ATPase [Acidimicrobiales bacterium]
MCENVGCCAPDLTSQRRNAASGCRERWHIAPSGKATPEGADQDRRLGPRLILTGPRAGVIRHGAQHCRKRKAYISQSVRTVHILCGLFTNCAIPSRCMSDLLGHPLSDTDRDNPFTPDFGVSPHVMAGRGAQTEELRTGLGLGPRNPRFTSVLIGHRGTGKTVLIDHAESMAARAGWHVLKTDATTPGIYERLEEDIAASIDDDVIDVSGGGTSRSETEWRLGVGVASVSRKSLPSMPDKWSLKRKIEVLGRSAAERNSAVLISLDELQSGDRQELRRLSADLQHLTKRGELPIAFVGAGLPVIEYTIMRDPKMTFFHRCHDIHLGPIDRTSALEFFSRAIRSAGGECDGDAMHLMSEASRGLPYKMQLIGDNAWRFSGSPHGRIDLQTARLAVSEAERRMTTRVYSHVWDSLSGADHSVLQQIAGAGGTTTRRSLGAAMPMKPSDLSNRLRRLETLGCVDRDGAQHIELGVLTPTGFVNDIIAEEAAVTPDPARIASSTAAPSAATTERRCNRPLKTINATCILRAGHKGRCRSR